ncbi:unnamed protein product [Spirodela intermedia]|uniref:sucrose-phosphate synthase n=1 Tax=Spirodela intermedia TaxID=51605 RepID=A0A7I8JE18_SPIIN|nr:unnamed protein product [Spirodela intermedia]CAA6668386.1 unnamed protein product [Spirodela intermedia]
MAGNAWINGYLEAILDSGAAAISAEDGNQQRWPVSPVELKDGPGGEDGDGGMGLFNPTRYFVEEVVTGVDETDLHRTWIKVVATRNTRERSSRLENMCWRIWHLARKKKQLEWENYQRAAGRRLEREQGRRDATEDMSEDLSEGEKGDAAGELSISDSSWTDDNKGKKLYIVLIRSSSILLSSLLARPCPGENMELGRDSDTGGQVKYVVELARALAMMPGVYRVDLFTRQISSPEVDWSYGEPTEMLTAGAEDADGNDAGESAGAYIVRIPFGPRDKYLRKEVLWPHIQEFVDGALSHILNMARVLGEQVGGGEAVWPYVVHGHYADAGDSAALLSGALSVPMVLTGHSLGRNKLEQLLKQGRQSKEDINATYKIMRRIEAEELSLDAAELLEKVLRARSRRGVNCHGRYMPRMAVIPPGMDFSNVVAQEDGGGEGEGDGAALAAGEGGGPASRAQPPIWYEPMILALSRPDPKKNITTLLKAFGSATLVMGNRDDIDEMSSGNASVLTTVLKLIDKYDLYGQVAYPKHHKQNDVPEIYRLAAKTKVRVFINPALVEPFGLTLIEAAAHGLPMVATQNGGPVDINRALNNGLLVDPHDQKAIADALLKLVADKNLWTECRKNGWKNIHLFSWPEHCRTYLTRVAACRMRHPQWQVDTPLDGMPAEESLGDSLTDFQESSLRLSVDGEKISLNDPDELEKVAEEEDDPSSRARGDLLHRPQQVPLLRRRRRLFVIALDCYDDSGRPDRRMLQVIQEVFRAVKLDSQLARISGFALTTAMPISETVELLKSGRIRPAEFDALICSSGSEVYYRNLHLPPRGEEDDGEADERPRRQLRRLPAATVVDEDVQSSGPHCVSFFVNDCSSAKKVDDLRQKLRMRGLRCHVMYCRNSTRLQVIPLLASRSQALRYLFVRWDDRRHPQDDNPRGTVEKGSEALLRAAGSYQREDIVPGGNPTTVHTTGGFKAEEILAARGPSQGFLRKMIRRLYLIITQVRILERERRETSLPYHSLSPTSGVSLK